MGQLKDNKKLTKILTYALVVIVVGSIIGLGIFLNWRPLKENGSTSSDDSFGQQSDWDDNFSNYLCCGIDNVGHLTDVIMLVSVDNTTKSISILQIPRDTYVDLDIPTNKINAIYSSKKENESGMEKLKSQVENDFGIKIRNYAAVTTNGFKSVVDSIGGVMVDVPIDMDYDDDVQDLHIHLEKGYQLLDGDKAEQFVRFRKGWSDGDIGRLSAQQLFLTALSDKINTLSTKEINEKVIPNIKLPDFKTDMTVYEIINFTESDKVAKFGSEDIITMPGEYFTYNKLDYYTPDKEQLLNILNQHFVPNGITLTIDDIKLKEKDEVLKN